jgi:hypothetical protein
VLDTFVLSVDYLVIRYGPDQVVDAKFSTRDVNALQPRTYCVIAENRKETRNELFDDNVGDWQGLASRHIQMRGEVIELPPFEEVSRAIKSVVSVSGKNLDSCPLTDLSMPRQLSRSPFKT